MYPCTSLTVQSRDHGSADCDGGGVPAGERPSPESRRLGGPRRAFRPVRAGETCWSRNGRAAGSVRPTTGRRAPSPSRPHLGPRGRHRSLGGSFPVGRSAWPRRQANRCSAPTVPPSLPLPGVPERRLCWEGVHPDGAGPIERERPKHAPSARDCRPRTVSTMRRTRRLSPSPPLATWQGRTPGSPSVVPPTSRRRPPPDAIRSDRPRWLPCPGPPLWLLSIPRSLAPRSPGTGPRTVGRWAASGPGPASRRRTRRATRRPSP